MKQEEAKRLIIREWDRWVQTQSINSGRATGGDSFKFFLELQDARAAFLDFSEQDTTGTSGKSSTPGCSAPGASRIAAMRTRQGTVQYQTAGRAYDEFAAGT
jgi:hypothetical protein